MQGARRTILNMKRILVTACLLVFLVGALPSQAGAARRLETLGKDAAGDSQPALDLVWLSAGADRETLEIRLGIAGMTPVMGGYPALPGIEWTFDVGPRTFVAEAVADTGGPAFYLFEMKGDSFVQLASPTGTYNPDDGYASILVPLSEIGARRGSVISGVGKKGTEDVDAHVHLGATTHYPDRMATTKDIVVP